MINVVKSIDNERPAYDVGVDGRTLHVVVQRGVDVARTRADDGEVNIFHFGTKGIDGSRYFVLLGDVSHDGESRVCFACSLFYFFIIHHSPTSTKGMLSNCPISRSIPCSKSTCSFFRNSTKKRKVNIVIIQYPIKHVLICSPQ